jgi:catenin beta 1
VIDEDSQLRIFIRFDFGYCNFVVVFCYFQIGYDALPVESMQGLELGSHHGGPPPSATSPTMGMGMNMGHSMGLPIQSNNYAPVDHMGSDLDFDPLNHMGQATPPQPPHDAQAAWYDTDL